MVKRRRSFLLPGIRHQFDPDGEERARNVGRVITVTGYNVTYDGNSHAATGTAKGVLNESLTGLDLIGATDTAVGDYPNDVWTFTDRTGNYNNASGTVHDVIAMSKIRVFA